MLNPKLLFMPYCYEVITPYQQEWLPVKSIHEGLQRKSTILCTAGDYLCTLGHKPVNFIALILKRAIGSNLFFGMQNTPYPKNIKKILEILNSLGGFEVFRDPCMSPWTRVPIEEHAECMSLSIMLLPLDHGQIYT